MNKEIKQKCSWCKNKAKYYIETEITKIHRLYEIGKERDMQLDEWDEREEENEYYCKKCAKKEDLI